MWLSLGDAGELLREGSTGDDVRTVQQLLTERGFDAGGIDGIFGPKTAQAVRSFQGNVGITIDGIVGGQTWGALLSAGPGARPAPPTPQPGLIAPIEGPAKPLTMMRTGNLNTLMIAGGLLVAGMVMMNSGKRTPKQRRRR